MFTRCPGCGTVFRVSPEQLRSKLGRVRCGNCLASFDALASLSEQPHVEEKPEPTLVPTADATTGEAVESIPEAVVADGLDETAATTPDPATETSELSLVILDHPPHTIAEEASLVMTEELPSHAPVAEATEPVMASTAAFAMEPAAHDVNRKQRSWPWWLGCFVAVVVLCLQGTMHYRDAIAARHPEAVPWLAMLCQPLTCAIGPPRGIASIEIESSDLVPDEKSPGHLRLVASLRSLAPHVLAWPHLELTLTDSHDKALLRRALAPAEYLPEGLAVIGLPARGEQHVRLDLSAADVPAVGYRLYLFYP